MAQTADKRLVTEAALAASLTGKQPIIRKYATTAAATAGLAANEFADGDLIVVLAP